ncbi:MAG: putative bifunctional diguanylate cyclase/phosphodiesterase [Coprococcus sp.]
MSAWFLSFDVAAMIFLLLIFVCYFNEKRIPLRSHGIFLYLVLLVFLSAGIEIASAFIAENISDVGYNNFYFILSIYAFTINMIPLAFSYYLLLIAHIDIEKKKILPAMYILCVSIDIIVIALNPFLHWAFTIENGTPRVGYACIFIHIVNIAMLFICILILVCKKTLSRFIRIVPLVFNAICCIVACIIQIYYHYPVLNCALAAVLLTLFHYQQNAGTVTDIVTGLFNRKFMGEYLQNKYLANKDFNIIVIAMDNFKFINKTYGVESGDHLLYQVGRLLEGLKVNKTIFRFGSDQFCLVLNNSKDNPSEVAEQIKNRFSYPWYDQKHVLIMMSASICCIECPKDAASYSELIEVIDYSMGIAKRTRKGLITFASEMELDKIKQDKAVERAVKLAIDKEQLMVYYQPIFSVTKNDYNSAEALVRLNDSKLGWISPEDFIPIAEKNGLIVEMGEIILTKVCRFIRDYKLEETSIEYIEVNVSPIQLIQPNFSDRVIAILEEYNVKPQQINIEITETATVNSAATVLNNIQRLVDYGITFSLDDYGSGNANISYINSMPFTIIKIDKFLIWDSFKNTTAGITLEYTIGMLNALKLHIVAEGVETEEMKQQLAKFGCHYLQGWYYSKAVPDTEFIALLGKQ